MKNHIKCFLLITVCFMFEIWWRRELKFYGVVPNIALCALIYIFANKKSPITEAASFAVGLMEYAVLGTFASLISYLIIIPVAGFFQKYIQENIIFYLINILITTCIYEISMWIFGLFKNINFSANSKLILIQIAYNIIIGAFLYLILNTFNYFEKETDFQ